MPDYPHAASYQADPVYGRLVFEALDIADRQLARILRFLRRDTDTVVLVASSMGQGPIPHRTTTTSLVIDDPDRLAAGLGLRGVVPQLTMYPRVAFALPDANAVADAAAMLTAVQTPSGPLFKNVHSRSNVVLFSLNVPNDGPVPTTASFLDGQTDRVVDLSELGVVAKSRPGGDNTAYHTREGILISGGRGQLPDSARRDVSVLDAAPSILDLLGLEAGVGMRGRPGLFT
jgi:hypothetical protein